jgi:hypothetical protein
MSPGNPKHIAINNCDAPETYLNKPDDEAEWHSGDHDTYRITFYAGPPGSPHVSPFYSDKFKATSTIPAQSGPIRPDAKPGPYKYRVHGDRGCDHDPVIRIGP